MCSLLFQHALNARTRREVAGGARESQRHIKTQTTTKIENEKQNNNNNQFRANNALHTLAAPATYITHNYTYINKIGRCPGSAAQQLTLGNIIK